MIILGVVCLIIAALVAKAAALWTVGIILVVVGVLLAVLGATGRPVAGRARWY